MILQDNYLNFNQSNFWYWPSNLGCSTFGKRILPLTRSRPSISPVRGLFLWLSFGGLLHCCLHWRREGGPVSLFRRRLAYRLQCSWRPRLRGYSSRNSQRQCDAPAIEQWRYSTERLARSILCVWEKARGRMRGEKWHVNSSNITLLSHITLRIFIVAYGIKPSTVYPLDIQ